MSRTLAVGDGCLYIGEHFSVWPFGTVRTADGVEVDGYASAIGDNVEGGGGYLSPDDARTLVDPAIASELDACTEEGDTIAVLQTNA